MRPFQGPLRKLTVGSTTSVVIPCLKTYCTVNLGETVLSVYYLGVIIMTGEVY